MILNDPGCLDCSDYGYTPGTGAPTGVVPSGPNAMIKDTGPVTLVANTPKTVLFSQISVIDETKWTFAGVPWCWNASSATIPFDITIRTGTGFTVTATEDSTFEFTAIKI